MNVTPKTARKSAANPVTDTLLELAYFLHATKVIGVRETKSESRRQPAAENRRSSEDKGSPLAS